MTQPTPSSDVKERAREVPLCTFCMSPHAATDDFCPTCNGPVGIMATAGALESIRAEYWLLGRQGPPRWMLRLVFLGIAVGLLCQVVFLALGLLSELESKKPWVSVLVGALTVAMLVLDVLVLRFLYGRWWKQPDATP